MTKNLTFEESMKKLETIVADMEKGELDLDKSLAMFEEGVKLVRFCSGKLEETKKKVEILIKKEIA
jgi:exodeoxyribonuclease VII small subunit